MTLYITFQMIDHQYTATHHQESGLWHIKEWVIDNIDRIDEIINVESENEEESHMYFHEIKKVISQYKQQNK